MALTLGSAGGRPVRTVPETSPNEGSTQRQYAQWHRYFPAATWVGRARRSLPKTRTQVRVQVRRGIRCVV